MASVTFSKCNDTVGNMNIPNTTVNTNSTLPDISKPKKKRGKRKKGGFNDIMSGFMTPSKTIEEVRKEHRDNIRKSLGGGGFQKVDKL
jgi:hypothetical protein